MASWIILQINSFLEFFGERERGIMFSFANKSSFYVNRLTVDPPVSQFWVQQLLDQTGNSEVKRVHIVTWSNNWSTKRAGINFRGRNIIQKYRHHTTWQHYRIKPAGLSAHFIYRKSHHEYGGKASKFNWSNHGYSFPRNHRGNSPKATGESFG